MRKSGFTLSELLIVLLIIGVLATIGLSTYSNTDKGIRYVYSNVYNALDQALYNTMVYWVSENEFERQPFKEKVYSNTAGSSTSNISDKQGAERLCVALTQYINTTEIYCSASRAVDDSGKDSLFTEANLQFVSANGMKFWISKRYPADGVNSDGMRFFIIYVDINGSKNPNSLYYRQNYVVAPGNVPPNDYQGAKDMRDPDIFPFAAMEDGRVVPIGVAEFEPRFLTSRLTYQYWNEEKKETEVKYTVKSRPYAYSKMEAWGYYTGSSPVPENAVIDGSPYTYNGYLRETIAEDSQIYSFMDGDTYANYIKRDYLFKDAAFRSNAPGAGGYSCVLMSDEECNVIIDKYR